MEYEKGEEGNGPRLRTYSRYIYEFIISGIRRRRRRRYSVSPDGKPERFDEIRGTVKLWG